MKTKKASFTLLETIVTIAIYAVMLLMITNIVILNAKLNEQMKMRTRIRNELSQISSSIKRDVRNADSINPDECQSTRCLITISGSVINWNLDANKLTRTANSTPTEITADYLIIDSVNFSAIAEPDRNNTKVTIILTIMAKGKNEAWNINNQVVQDIISIRNFDLNP